MAGYSEQQIDEYLLNRKEECGSRFVKICRRQILDPLEEG